MENKDHRTEQQVWQRVRASREEPPKEDLRQLQREAMELAAVYRSLTSQMTGKQQALLKRLYAGEKANGEALAGIARLSRLGGESLKFWQPGKEDSRRLLERCYHRTRRCTIEYLARSAEGEFGVVFEKLANREKEHCCLIAEVLGGMQ